MASASGLFLSSPEISKDSHCPIITYRTTHHLREHKAFCEALKCGQERGPFQFVNVGLMIEGPPTDFTCDQFLGDAHRAVDGGSYQNGDDGERLGY